VKTQTRTPSEPIAGNTPTCTPTSRCREDADPHAHADAAKTPALSRRLRNGPGGRSTGYFRVAPGGPKMSFNLPQLVSTTG
jgi:hypothetical protein